MNLLFNLKKRLFYVVAWFLAASVKKKLLIGCILLVILWLGVPRVLGLNKQALQYQTAQVTKGSVISTVSETGNVSGNTTNITSPTNGVITNIFVKNGDEVSVGENLFEVKSTASPQEQAAAYATYQSAISSLTTAQDNKQSLDATMWTSQKAVLDAQNNVNYAQNNTTNPSTKQTYTDLEHQSLNSSLTQAQKDFSANEQKYKDAGVAVAAAQAQENSAALSYQATQNSVVTAPISGTVANLSSAIGSGVTSSGASSATTNSTGASGSSTSSSSSSTSSPVMVIGDFSTLIIKVQVSEVDVPKIKSGQKATITLDAFPGKTFVGNVTSIDTVGTSSSGVVTYNAYVMFDYVPSGIQPGMTASVTIQTDRRDDVLSVPTSAVQTASDGTQYVRVLKNGKVSQVTVETGISSDTDTEITSGLSENDTVITSIVTTGTAGSGQTASPFSGVGGRGGFGGGFGGGARGGGGGAGRTGN